MTPQAFNTFIWALVITAIIYITVSFWYMNFRGRVISAIFLMGLVIWSLIFYSIF